MHEEYKNTNTNYFKSCLKEVGEAARQNGDFDTYHYCVEAWKRVDEYEDSLIAPWD
jgi:hypothetical protein